MMADFDVPTGAQAPGRASAKQQDCRRSGKLDKAVNVFNFERDPGWKPGGAPPSTARGVPEAPKAQRRVTCGEAWFARAGHRYASSGLPAGGAGQGLARILRSCQNKVARIVESMLQQWQ